MNINLIRNNINKHYKEKSEAHKEIAHRRNSKWNKLYQDHRWKRLREWKIQHDPICELCLKEGVVTPADEIHHLQIIGSGINDEDKFRLLLDPLNLCSCCSRHHDVFHAYLKENNKVYASLDEVFKYDIKINTFE